MRCGILTIRIQFSINSLANKIATIITAAHNAKPIIHRSRLRQLFDLRRLSLVTYSFSPLEKDVKDIVVINECNAHKIKISSEFD